MVLYNKDGTVYKLSSPNKIMKTQIIWEENCFFYNLEWLGKFERIDNEIKNKLKIIEKEEQEKEKDIEEQNSVEILKEIKVKESYEKLEEIKSENILIKVKEEPSTLEEIFFSNPVEEKKDIVVKEIHIDQKEEVIKEPKKTDLGIEKTFVFCLPAFHEKDQNFEIKLKYGNPFSLETVILFQTDLILEIWTNVENIEKGSILYPRTGFKRWWKVQNRKPKAQGWVLTAIPSDFHPSFDGI